VQQLTALGERRIGSGVSGVTTILVVEDDVEIRTLLRGVLEVWNCIVLDAEGAEQGWAVLQRALVDLVVTDSRLPDGSGEELLQRMKADPRLQGLPVLAVAGLPTRGDRARLLAAGFDECLQKPIDTHAFSRAVAALLRGTAP
jgi:DNA-binding response OmpR family regulator